MEYLLLGLLLWVAGALVIACTSVGEAIGVRGVLAWPLLVPLGALRLLYAVFALPLAIYRERRPAPEPEDPVAASLARAYVAQDEAREHYELGLTSAGLASEAFAAEWHAMACAYADDLGRDVPAPLDRSRAMTPQMRDVLRREEWNKHLRDAAARSAPRFSSGGLIDRSE